MPGIQPKNQTTAIGNKGPYSGGGGGPPPLGGDVFGPATNPDRGIPIWNRVDSKTLQNSGLTLSSAGPRPTLSGLGRIEIDNIFIDGSTIELVSDGTMTLNMGPFGMLQVEGAISAASLLVTGTVAGNTLGARGGNLEINRSDMTDLDSKVTIYGPESNFTAYAVTLPPLAPTSVNQVLRLNHLTSGHAGSPQFEWAQITASDVRALPVAGGSMAGQIGMTGHNITRVGDITLEETGAGTDAITIRAPVSITPYTLVLPIDDGDAGEVLSTDGSGVLSWIPPQSGWIRLRRTANQTGYTTGQKITWQASESGGSNPPTFSGPSSTITLPVGTWELVGNLSGQSFSGPTASSQSKWTDGAGTPLGDSTEVYLESRQSTTSSNDNPQNTAIVVVASGTTDVELEATRGSGSHDITGATAWAFIRKIG